MTTGMKLRRWVYSLLCRWFPGRVRVRRRPVVRHVKPALMVLEDRWSPTSLSGATPVELPSSLPAQMKSDTAATTSETRKAESWAEMTPSENIVLISPSRQTDDTSTFVRTPQFQDSSPSSNSNQQNATVLDDLAAPQSPRPFSPLSTPPKPLPSPPANAGGGGGGVGGRSTPNAGMGGGGPTGGGGGGPGVVNANQFVGVNFGASYQPEAQATVSHQPEAQARESAPPTESLMSYSMTPPSLVQPQYQSLSPSLSAGHGHGHRHDPLYVLDMNTGETIPANVTLNTFSTWSENLMAQVAGTTVTSYSWNVSQAPDFTPSTSLSSYNLQGTWASFTGPARTDIISVTETDSIGAMLTQTMTYEVAGTNSPAFSSSRPTSSATWASVLTPDQLSADQATGDFGSYASYGLADGSAQTFFAMPSYNPNVVPAGLVYDSAAAANDPVFVVHYQYPGGLSSITAQLTLNGVAGPQINYGTSGNFNPGDWLQIALQENTAGNNIGLSTGRYPWTITLSSSGTTLATYSGNVDIVNESSSPYGAGWSLGGVEQLVPVSGGVILVQPGGTSLWFASNGNGGFTTPAGDFSTLVQNANGSYTRTLTDCTQINFNSSGQQTSVVDTDGNTTTYNYSGGLLTSITDMNGQTTTLSYSGGLLASITDPAGRTATMGYSGGDLTSITDPGNNLWQYSYDANGRMTALTDPNNHTAGFNYDSAGLLSGLNFVNTTISYSFVPMEWNGLAIGTSSYANAQLLAVGDSAKFYDANDNPWTTGLDWLGFGEDVQDLDPIGEADLTYRDGNGLPWLFADGLGRRIRDFFDSKGNPTEIVYADDTTEKYQYNACSEVTQYTDPSGAVTTYTYNSKGDLTQVQDALGNTTTFTYNPAALVASIEDPLLHTTTFGYNTLNELTSITNALNQTTTLGYDSAGNLTSITDPLGYVSTFAYNSLGWLMGETLADTSTLNSVYTFTYDKVGNMLSETTPLGGTYGWGYDVLNRLIGYSAPLEGTYSLVYDNNNRLMAVTNPLGASLSYGYCTCGCLTSFTDYAGDTTSYTYNAAHELTSVTNPLGYTTNYGYTQRGQLASVTDPLGDFINYSYNAAGDRTAMSQGGPNSSTNTVTYAYNTLHQLTIATDQLGHSTTHGYDAGGNQTSLTDPLGHAVTYGYNALNQLTVMTDALGHQTTFGYDANGNQTSITDPLGRLTTKSYDAQGRVLSVTDPLGGIASYTYDSLGDQTSITDPVGNTTTFGYDAAGKLTSVANALGTTTYQYNNIHELVSKKDADGRTTSYTYDNAGRETNEEWLNSLNQPIYTATYTYDHAGELTGASDPYSSYTYTYDHAGRETSVSNAGTPGVPTVTLSFGYDAFGNRTSLSDSLGGSISYSFDAANRLTGLAMTVNGSVAAQVTLGYDAANRLTGLTRTAPSVSGDTITSSYSYDNADRLTNITHTDTTKTLTLASFTYGYNNANEMTSYQDNSGNALAYGNDAIGELTSATGTLAGSNYTFTYNYDKNGNRTSTSTDVNGTLTSATYTTGADNELTNDGTYSYTYDAEGNLTSQTNIQTGSVTYYTWDYRNRLTEVKVENSLGTVLNDETFTYDVLNNRIAVSLNGSTQLYTVYDGANPYMDFNSSGQLTQRYLTNPKALSQFYGQVSASGTTQWFLTDNLGSIRQVVSTSGSTLDAITYDPYGQIITQTNAVNAPRFLYTGGAYDSITGDYQDGRRFEDSIDGRFVSEDPLSFQGGDTNLYRYTHNHPSDATDPSGLSWTNRLTGALQWLGGTAIMVGGAGLMALPVPGLAQLGGFLIALYGFDQAYAGVQQMWSGEFTQSYTSKGLTYINENWLGMGHQAAVNAAEMQNAGIGIMAGLGTSFATLMSRQALMSGSCGAAGTGRLVRVTSWAERGIDPDLNSGRWVQLGGPTRWNFFKTGLPGGKVIRTTQFPWFTWVRSNVPFTNYITDFIDQTRLLWPKELGPFFDLIKGLLGQRKLQ